MKKLFISRDLENDPQFVKELLVAGIVVHGQSLVSFQKVSVKQIPESDWIFFYSKQGIRHYFDELDDPAHWAGVRMGMPRKIKALKYATFGEGSARFLESYRGIKADFVGLGNATDTTQSFLKVAKGTTVLFVRGQNSLQSVQQLLSPSDLQMMDLVVYDNQPITSFSVPQCHYLLFTSPLNANAYYARYTVKKWQKVFAIGETTAEALVSLGLKEVTVAPTPSIAAMAHLVLESNR